MFNYPQMDRVFPQTCRMKKKTEALTEKQRRTAVTLGQNVSALMGGNESLDSNPKVSKATKLSTSTLSRLRNGQVNANLETLEAIAEAFDVEPWQLLVPGFQPANPPVLGMAGQKEQDLYNRFMSAAKEIVQIEKEEAAK